MQQFLCSPFGSSRRTSNLGVSFRFFVADVDCCWTCRYSHSILRWAFEKLLEHRLHHHHQQTLFLLSLLICVEINLIEIFYWLFSLFTRSTVDSLQTFPSSKTQHFTSVFCSWLCFVFPKSFTTFERLSSLQVSAAVDSFCVCRQQLNANLLINRENVFNKLFIITRKHRNCFSFVLMKLEGKQILKIYSAMFVIRASDN